MSLRDSTADDRGFSLPEMLVVLALIGLVLATAYLMLSAGTRIADGVEARDSAASQGQLAMETMSRELRQGLELVDGAGVFASIASRQCIFYVDLDHDRFPERVTYRVDGDSLVRTTATATNQVPPYTFGSESAPMVIASNLRDGWTGAIFTYYDTDESVVSFTTPAEVSAVKLDLQTQSEVGRQVATATNTTWVRIRTVHNSIR